MYYKVEITQVFSSKMINESIFKAVCWFMICRDLKKKKKKKKKSDTCNRPYKISPNTDVSVAENGPILSNRRPIHFLVTFILK